MVSNFLKSGILKKISDLMVSFYIYKKYPGLKKWFFAPYLHFFSFLDPEKFDTPYWLIQSFPDFHYGPIYVTHSDIPYGWCGHVMRHTMWWIVWPGFETHHVMDIVAKLLDTLWDGWCVQWPGQGFGNKSWHKMLAAGTLT